MSKAFILPFRLYDNNIYTTLLRHIKIKLEGHCLKEGYVKPESVEIIEYSPGSIMGENVKFLVSLQCMVCHPVVQHPPPFFSCSSSEEEQQQQQQQY